MGLLDGLLGGSGGMKDPVRGTAQVVSCSRHTGRGIMQNCHMQLVVQGDGVPATAVEMHQLVHNKRWPSPGMVLPVTVDRGNPQKVKVEWDEVQSSRDRGRQTAEGMAAAMRGEGGDPAMGGLGGAQVINLSGQSLEDLPEEKKQKLRMLGLLPSEPAAEPAGEDEEIDDRLEQLERLAKLRDQGVLTDEEFAEQKRQILGG